MGGRAGTALAAERWRALQLGRGIPAEILTTAPADPWRLDPTMFRAPERPEHTPSRAAGLALLGGRGGTVLDVGCGGGAASVALSRHAVRLTGLDSDPSMLAAFAAACAERGVRHGTVQGAWPHVAPQAGPHDVVLCHHVVHNTTELAPFLAALDAAARRGVVVEMFAEHPLAWLDPLWERFHGLVRPPSATVDDAVAVLAEIGIRPAVTTWERTRSVRGPDMVARLLCLPPSREAEVAEALDRLPSAPRQVATLSWRSPTRR